MRIDYFKAGVAYWIGWLLTMCFIFYNDNIGNYRSSEKLKAEVVDRLVGIGKGRSPGRGYYYYPQLKFRYNDSTYLFADASGFAPGRHDVGDKLTVIFPKGEPDRAVIYFFLPYWVSLAKLFFGFMIALFLFVLPWFFKSYGAFKKEYRQINKRSRDSTIP